MFCSQAHRSARDSCREGEKSTERPTIESHTDHHFNKYGDWTLLGPHCEQSGGEELFGATHIDVGAQIVASLRMKAIHRTHTR